MHWNLKASMSYSHPLPIKLVLMINMHWPHYVLARLPKASSEGKNRSWSCTTNTKCNSTTLPPWTPPSCDVEASQNLSLSPLEEAGSLIPTVNWDSRCLSEYHPRNLLTTICCNCKEGERQYQTMKCSSIKAGMSCVFAFRVCCWHFDVTDTE